MRVNERSNLLSDKTKFLLATLATAIIDTRAKIIYTQITGLILSNRATDALPIARRYAAAIFSLAVADKKEQRVTDEISALAAATIGHVQLAEIIANPTIANAQKAAILALIIAKADQLTRRAVEVIAHGGRVSLIPAIALDVKARLAAHRGEVEAQITSARALGAATREQLAQSLARATGKTVTLKLREDASVLGGLRIEIGSLRFDATLAGALNRMSNNLIASAES